MGYALLFVVLATILATAYKTGASMDVAIIDCIVETLLHIIIQGASDLFSKIARFIPYVGFLVSVIGGWLLQYALTKLFNSSKCKRIKNKFAKQIKNTRTSLWNWLKTGVKCLSA